MYGFIYTVQQCLELQISFRFRHEISFSNHDIEQEVLEQFGSLFCFTFSLVTRKSYYIS